MNIDLFMTDQNEAALVCGGVFTRTLGGIILDAQTHEVTLEFTDGMTEHLNIPFQETHKEKLLFAHKMFVGCLESGFLTDTMEIPMMYLNDPYGGQFGNKSHMPKPAVTVTAFEQFMKRAKFAQALHRDNLGDEDTARSVLMGVDHRDLKYSPTLQRQIQINATPKVKASPQMPNLGGGSAATTQTKMPPSEKDDSSKS